jgi:hypothetical protein
MTMRVTKNCFSTMTRATLIGSLLGFAGCSQPASPPPAAATKPTASAVDDQQDHAHDHAHGDHEHGAGPHGGTLADWGAGLYHVEFTVDHDNKESVVYVLGSDEKTPSPIKTTDGRLLLTIREPSFQVELAARPLEGESEGAASRYVGTHDSLGIVREFVGTISGEVEGTPYAGDFEEHAHDHE